MEMKAHEVITQAFDIEIARLAISPDMEKIYKFFMDDYLSKDIYTFFVLLNIKELSQSVNSTPEIRDFLYNVTHKVSLELGREGKSFLINSIVDHLDSPSEELTFMPIEILETLRINLDTLKELLTTNFWLVVLYYLRAYMYKTDTYKSFIREYTNDK